MLLKEIYGITELMEPTEVPLPSFVQRISDLSKQMDVAKNALDLAGRLRDPSERRHHLVRVSAIMNRISMSLERLKQAV